jgi:hypothetical protein
VPREQGVSRERLLQSMSQVHSRFNGCVDIGAVRARSGRVAALAALKVAFFPLANDENEVMTR